VDLREMDVQHVAFADASFDTVVSTFVFCSVPDPVAGLREIRRVLRPDGRLLMLEHVLSQRHALGALMNAVNPIVVRMMGANINRRTRQNLEKAGLHVERAEPLWADIFWLFIAHT
jgi:ubiquinone/menaquinone biosynthesis C-methylase UbiE